MRLARRLTGRRLRILCYHGIALADEHRFRGGLFMHPDTFAERMRWLKAADYPVLPLGEALERLGAGTLPRGATVLTFDDGWKGTYRHAFPVLHELGFPATLYVTSYYAVKQTQVFNVTTRYLFWRAERDRLDLAAVDPYLRGEADLRGAMARDEAADRVIRFGREHYDAPGRQALLRRLGEALGIDVPALEEQGVFRLVSGEEVAAAASDGIDIQLHSHRHNLAPFDRQTLTREIEDNRAALAAWIPKRLEHFCYPGGLYERSLWPTLQALGITSATTCITGLNTARTSRLELRRLLDDENLTLDDIEAEMSGLQDLRRGLVGALRRGGAAT
ncbi:hypothetical protein DEM34_15150 [Spiribacter halobius]|uniref:NodB homology domain-containing protein n=2 Tax=Sediminicurvatus halobius TaxID=2182432 RepID=A0A2U2MXL6_9GAMM|nr:hypothetical protein DEM34_15150 [Spiribacter halobius]